MLALPLVHVTEPHDAVAIKTEHDLGSWSIYVGSQHHRTGPAVTPAQHVKAQYLIFGLNSDFVISESLLHCL